MIGRDYRRRAPGLTWFTVHFFWDLVAGLVRGFFGVVYHLRASGVDRVPREGPLIFVANHQSHYDPPLIGSVIRDRPCRFLARKTLFEFLPFALLIRLLGAIPLDREGSGTGALRFAVEELQAGRTLLMFPEGTRTRDGSIARFKPGVMLLVRKTRAAVVPVAIDGLHEVWPPHRSRPRWRGRIAVGIGDPIPADDLLAREPAAAVERLREAVVHLHDELRRDDTSTRGHE